MLGKLNHVAIAVPDLETAASRYRDILGAKTSKPQELPEHGVRVVFVELPNTRIELMEPFGPNSPICKFLASNPAGGIHHICYEVEDIALAKKQLENSGVRILGSGQAKKGAHGKSVLFLHPKDFQGALIELAEV